MRLKKKANQSEEKRKRKRERERERERERAKKDLYFPMCLHNLHPRFQMSRNNSEKIIIGEKKLGNIKQYNLDRIKYKGIYVVGVEVLLVMQF